MSAELKKLMSEARSQQLRTQMLLNSIAMRASPIHHHKLAERQKKGACVWERRGVCPSWKMNQERCLLPLHFSAVEEEHQALVAMEQELEPQ